MSDNFYTSEKWKRLRKKRLRADMHTCLYCESTKNLVVHHIRPRSMGGKDKIWNLVTLCKSCHSREHVEIKKDGLCCIPGPEWRPWFAELTDQEAVNKNRQRLIDCGLTPRFQ